MYKIRKKKKMMKQEGIRWIKSRENTDSNEIETSVAGRSKQNTEVKEKKTMK
jgi:hypothetical protein